MGRIQQLDAQTANMIAAGEVVERPMGVVKELVENAIDAGSTRINISIEEGGIKKITIQDNGSGMDSTDAEMAFRRHATSKIRNQNDLWSIHTLGFRGEALPSIASVSKTTMITSDGNDATKIVIEYGKTVSVSAYPCNQGTQITVEGLFYQTPARLKHMRSASYEASLIQDVIARFALSHPEISFHFYNEDRESFMTTGQGDLLEVLYQVYGRGAYENALEADFSDYDYTITGYLIKPEINRATRNAMHVFLNGRMVRTYKIYKAIQDGYEGYLAKGRYPMCVLKIEMDPHILDVNVHPSKWEVRLSKEAQLEYLIRDNIQKTLQSHLLAPQAKAEEARIQYYEPLSFDTDDLEPKKPEPAKEETVQHEEKKVQPDTVKEEIRKEAEEDNALLRKLASEVKEEPQKIEKKPDMPKMRVIGQLHQKYILCETEQGLAIINQRTAMERINYEEYLKKMKNPPVMMDLLVPVTLHVSDDIVQRAEEINTALSGIHISFEPFGRDTFLVRSLPSWMKDLNHEKFLQDVLDLYKSEMLTDIVRMQYGPIAGLASRNAVGKVQSLSMEEMNTIVERLSACENPYYGNNGVPVFMILDEKELTKGLSR